jgi:hypothetical protein
MGLKERSNFDSAYFDRCNNAKPKPETEFIPVSRYSHEKFWPSCPQN